MGDKSDLKAVSDDELLRRLSDLTRQSRRVEADLVAHIGEVDARRLYAREAAPSMFAYCMARYRRKGPRVSEPTPVYASGRRRAQGTTPRPAPTARGPGQ